MKIKAKFNKNLLIFLYSLFEANIISFSYGTSVGWTSPFLPVLLSDDSPLPSGSITSEEASWIGSLLCLGAIVGTISVGFLADLIGRKKTALLLAIPQTVSYIVWFKFKS